MPSATPNSALHNARALGWVSFFTDTASAMVTVLLPLFLLQTLGQTPRDLGLVVAIGTFVSFAFRWLAGYLSDYTQRPKWLAGSGYLVSAIAKPSLALCQGWLGVALLRVGDRLGKAARSAPRDVLIISQAAGRTSEAFSLHKMFDLAGELAGLVLVACAFFIWSESTENLVRPLLLCTALPGVIAVSIFFLRVREPARQASLGPPRWTFRPLSSHFVVLACQVGLLLEQPMLLGRLVELGVDGSLISLAVIIALLAALMATRGFRNRMTDRRTIVYALLINLGGLPLAIHGSVYLLCGALVATTMAQAILLTCSRSRLAQSRSSRSGTAYGSFYLVVAVTGALTTSIGGWAWERFGFAIFIGWLWWVSLIVATIIGVQISSGRGAEAAP